MSKKQSMFYMADEDLGVGIPNGRSEKGVAEDLELLAFFRNLFENEIEPELKRIIAVGEKESAEMKRVDAKKKKAKPILN